MPKFQSWPVERKEKQLAAPPGDRQNGTVQQIETAGAKQYTGKQHTNNAGQMHSLAKGRESEPHKKNKGKRCKHNNPPRKIKKLMISKTLPKVSEFISSVSGFGIPGEYFIPQLNSFFYYSGRLHIWQVFFKAGHTVRSNVAFVGPKQRLRNFLGRASTSFCPRWKEC